MNRSTTPLGTMTSSATLPSASSRWKAKNRSGAAHCRWERFIRQYGWFERDRPLVFTWEYLPGSWRPITQTVGPAADDLEFYAVISDLVGTPTELITADGARVAWTNGDRTLWGAPAGRGEAAAKNTGGLS